MPILADVVPLVRAWRVDRTFTYLVPQDLTAKIQVGSLVRVPFGHRKVRGIVVSVAEREPPGELGSIISAVVAPPVAPVPMIDVLEWLAMRYVTPRGVVYERVVPNRVRVKLRDLEITSTDSPPELLPRYAGGTELLEAIASGGSGTWCLQALGTDDRGALVSELVAAALRSDAGAALIAVPEVRYGSLLIDRVCRDFLNARRVDSSVGDPERAESWLALASGARVGIGGRACVLAPVPQLRLIVVDEEPNRAYKDDRSPRFDARLTAVERARASGAVCVFVALAPSVRAGWAARSGAARWVAAPRDLQKAARPNVELTEPEDRALSHYLHKAIATTLGKGERVGLLVPQSGYARAVWCSSCRRSVRCPRCEAGTIYDRERRSLRCPRCAYRASAPDVCPSCGAHEFRYLGAGSERLQEQLGHSFPRARVVRVDPAILEAQQDAPDVSDADIYVTTWIGTKAVLRPDVKLVGVLDADALIRRPDFRASENAYQALVEMSDWAGPSSEGGRLVIQTAEPGHHAIQAVVRGDYRYFLEREAAFRQELRYPPFSELIKVRAAGPEAATVLRHAAETAATLGAVVLGPIAVSTPTETASELLLKCDDAGKVAAGLRVILPQLPQGTHLRVDVDPR